MMMCLLGNNGFWKTFVLSLILMEHVEWGAGDKGLMLLIKGSTVYHEYRCVVPLDGAKLDRKYNALVWKLWGFIIR
jgi:hypothetical protein